MSLLKEINNLKLIRFLFISSLSFILNNLFNYIFIELFEFKEYLSTAITYIILLILNFFLCKFYVFNVKTKSLNFLNFFSIVGSFRFLEYISFLIIYNFFELHYLVIINTVSIIFLFTKFIFLNRTSLERKIII